MITKFLVHKSYQPFGYVSEEAKTQLHMISTPTEDEDSIQLFILFRITLAHVPKLVSNIHKRSYH